MHAHGVKIVRAGQINARPSKTAIGNLRVHPASRGNDGVTTDDAIGNLQAAGFAVVAVISAERVIQ